MCANHTTATTQTAQLQAARFQLSTLAAKGGVNEEAGLCFDERELRPLPTYVLAALDLTAAEKENATVIVLTGDHHPEETAPEQCVSRLAVCRPIHRAALSKLAAGAVIIYTEAYKFTVKERPFTAHIPTLHSHAGTVRFSDTERGLLYTTTWEGNYNEERSHQYGDVYELWQVQRFITLAYAK
jgi:hypothetical protein